MTSHRVVGLLVAGALLLLFTGCSTFLDARRLSWVKDANPKHDCELAIDRGDLRFYAVNGIASEMVVGTDQHGADAALILAHGVRTIAGTSDCSSIRLNQRASEYARTYNVALLRYLRARPRQLEYERRLAVARRGGTRADVQKAFPEVRLDAAPRSLTLTPLVGSEFYRLDRDFVLTASFRYEDHRSSHAFHKTAAPPQSSLSASDIDRILFGSMHHSPRVPRHPISRREIDRLLFDPVPRSPKDLLMDAKIPHNPR